MSDREAVHAAARSYFESLWQQGDFWDFEQSDYERDRCAHLLDLLSDRRYERALEIGCGAGYFTDLLTRVADHILALDVSPAAIARAQAGGAAVGKVEWRVANIMREAPLEEGPWDLLVMSEIIYYLGWLYTFFDVGWLAHRIFDATAAGGRLLLSNTMSESDHLMLPWLVRTYRDLFLNVGFRLENEQIFRGTKTGVEFEILVSLFVKGNPRVTR